MTHGGLRLSAVDPRGFLGAVQFLTRIPVGAGSHPLSGTVVWMPVVGAILGAILGAVDLGLRWIDAPPILESTLLVVLLLALTGALHADGLMDTCDAVFGHASPERRLEIMRDPRAGAFGVVGLVSVFALKVAALDGLSPGLRPGLLLLAPTLGRWTIVFLATVFPYGRASGLGAPLKTAATPGALALASVLPLAACVVIGPIGVACAAVSVVAAYGIGRWLCTLLPGLTGDCYGAVCELTETLVWVGGALVTT
ncbi:MAG: adenosylcobinamide-GDP ribazoletransferase [Chloroflexi bacterium]|nr:adenosylcobinamide-GDP ribazoletransferase [Chloroflexota bacterium]MBV9131368.1 adenosylcobinamide-GDP ribazoletransferase [Chloroflexota bacterium]MBV9896058.1 adenosylcobinamide-GDP ribazoletransferase [Chloroflexota bacterium]